MLFSLIIVVCRLSLATLQRERGHSSCPVTVSASGQTTQDCGISQASVSPAAAAPAVADKIHYVFLQPFSIYTKKEQKILTKKQNQKTPHTTPDHV